MNRVADVEVRGRRSDVSERCESAIHDSVRPRSTALQLNKSVAEVCESLQVLYRAFKRAK
jgi:hypothetical protein